MNSSTPNSVKPKPRALPEFADTWLENWPAELAAFSFRHIGIPLNFDEAHALGRSNGIHRHCFQCGGANTLPDLTERLESVFSHFPGGAFVRPGSRSPKDTPLAQWSAGKVATGKQAISALTAGSARMAYDLRTAVRCQYQAWIFVREWQDIPPAMEFRGFMQNHQLIGVSQYFHSCHFPELASQTVTDAIQSALSAWFPLFSQCCHLADVVFDVAVDTGPPALVKLIEINPFAELTEACLYSWKQWDFDGGLRIRASIEPAVKAGI